MNNLFLELIQLSVGTRAQLQQKPTDTQWDEILFEAERQAVAGVMVDGLEKLSENQRPPQAILLQWIGTAQIEEQTYRLHCERARELSERFQTAGYRSCVLKGIGNAQYYPNPQRRQCGDIDIWVANASGVKVKDSLFRKTLIGYLQKHGQIGSIDIKHCDWNVFEDTPAAIFMAVIIGVTLMFQIAGHCQ